MQGREVGGQVEEGVRGEGGVCVQVEEGSFWHLRRSLSVQALRGEGVWG